MKQIKEVCCKCKKVIEGAEYYDKEQHKWKCEKCYIKEK